MNPKLFSLKFLHKQHPNMMIPTSQTNMRRR